MSIVEVGEEGLEAISGDDACGFVGALDADDGTRRRADVV